MDLRYERLRYFRRVSRKEKRGIIYHEPWHMFGSYRKQREDKYKNIDRTTIRRWRVGSRPEPSVWHTSGKPTPIAFVR